MTEKGFVVMVEYIEGAYMVDFTEGTKEAWWTSFLKIPDDVALIASRKVAARDDLRKPHLGALLETCNAIAKEREGKAWALPADASRALRGIEGRLARESLHGKLWKPTTEDEREGAFLFRDLVHQAHGLFDHVKMQPVTKPRLGTAALAALTELGGFQSLRGFGLHDILMAREAFAKAYAKAATPGGLA